MIIRAKLFIRYEPYTSKGYRIIAKMPGEVIDRPNPQPLPSHLPDDLEKLKVKLTQEAKALDQKACDALFKFRRAASYIAAGKLELKGLADVDAD